MAQEPIEITSLSFEDALKELETIVRRLESGDSPLEKAIEEYARGTALKQHCQKRLESARLKVEKLSQSPTGAITAEPFENA